MYPQRPKYIVFIYKNLKFQLLKKIKINFFKLIKPILTDIDRVNIILVVYKVKIFINGKSFLKITHQ